MAVPVALICSANDKNNTRTTIATILAVVYFILFVLAIYLAIRDMQFLPHTSTKIWVFVLAFFLPDLYVILHGISASAQNVGFFAGSPLPSGSSGLMGGGGTSVLPTLSPDTLSSSSLGSSSLPA